MMIEIKENILCFVAELKYSNYNYVNLIYFLKESKMMLFIFKIINYNNKLTEFNKIDMKVTETLHSR